VGYARYKRAQGRAGLINFSEGFAGCAAVKLARLRSDSDSSAETEVRCFATDSVEKFERLGSHFLGRPTGKVELVDLGG